VSGRRAAFFVLSVGVILGIGVHAGARAAEQPPTHGMALDSVAVLVSTDLLRGAELPPGRPILLATPVPGDTLGLLTQRMVERLRALGAVVRLSSHGTNGAAPPNGAMTGATTGSMTGALEPLVEPSRIAPDTAAVPGGASGSIPYGSAPAQSAPPEPAPARANGGAPGPVQLQLQVDGSGVTYVRRLGKFPFGTKGYERLSAMRAVATLLDPVTGDVFWSRSAARSRSDVVPKSSVAYAASGSGRLNPPVPKGGTRWLEPLIVVGVVAGLVVLFYSNRN
jgi:hypothetical protein